jgi:hypothetical protein
MTLTPMVDLENGNIIRVHYNLHKNQYHAIIGCSTSEKIPYWNAIASTAEEAVELLIKTIRECPNKFFFNKEWKDPCPVPQPMEMIKVNIPKHIQEGLVSLAKDANLPLFTLLDQMIKDAQSKRTRSNNSSSYN